MPGQSQCCWCWPEKWGLWGQDFLCDVRFLWNCHATWKITVLTTMSLGRFSSRLVFALWWLAKLADSFKESIFSVSVAIWRCSWRNCLSVSTVQETGGLIGVELGILYDSRELERLSGGEVVNEVPSKSEPRPSSNCKSRRVLACRFSVRFLSTKMRGRSCPRGTIVCESAKQIKHAINSKSKWFKCFFSLNFQVNDSKSP